MASSSSPSCTRELDMFFCFYVRNLQPRSNAAKGWQGCKGAEGAMVLVSRVLMDICTGRVGKRTMGYWLHEEGACEGENKGVDALGSHSQSFQAYVRLALTGLLALGESSFLYLADLLPAKPGAH